MRSVLVLVIVGFAAVSAIPKPNKTRVKEEVNLTFLLQRRYVTNFHAFQLLSEKKHYDGDEHNPDYDHDAFLGEEAKTFDQLTPEESQERLA